MYVIIWRHTHREPHLDLNDRSFLESYSTYEQAKDAAENTLASEGDESHFYYDYAIYQESIS